MYAMSPSLTRLVWFPQRDKHTPVRQSNRKRTEALWYFVHDRTTVPYYIPYLSIVTYTMRPRGNDTQTALTPSQSPPLSSRPPTLLSPPHADLLCPQPPPTELRRPCPPYQHRARRPRHRLSSRLSHQSPTRRYLPSPGPRPSPTPRF